MVAHGALGPDPATSKNKYVEAFRSSERLHYYYARSRNFLDNVVSNNEFLHKISQYLPSAAIEMDAVDVEAPAALSPDLVKALMKYEDLESGLALG